MARPAKPDDRKRKQVGERFEPEIYAALSRRAEQSGRTLAKEVEHRASVLADAGEQTLALLSSIAERIGQLEKATQKRWHEDLETWSAVKSMLGTGPILAVKPLLPGEETELSEAIAPINEIFVRQQELAKSIGKLGVTVKVSSHPITGLGIGLDPRRTEKAAIASIQDEQARAAAQVAHAKLIELDQARLVATREAAIVESAYSSEIERGAERWQDFSLAETTRRSELGEKLRIDELVGLYLTWR